MRDALPSVCRLVAFVVAGAVSIGCDTAAERDAGPRDSGAADSGTDSSTDPGLGPLSAEAGDSFYASVGQAVVLDGSASVGATRYRWDFGDGRGWDAARSAPTASTSYREAGRYRAFLTVADERGRTRTDSVVVHVTELATHTPQASASVAVWPARQQVAVVSPDSDELAIYSYADGLTLVHRAATGDEPVTVTVFEDRWAVVCAAADEIDLIDDAGVVTALRLPRASRPHGAVSLTVPSLGVQALYVTLTALGSVARVVPGRELDVFPAIEDARGIAALPDGGVLVTRWRSPPAQAEMVGMSPDGAVTARWTLAYDPQPGSDTESGGVPSYLDQVAIAPSGALAAVPSTQAAIGEGLFRSPRALTYQTTVRAALSYVDVSTGSERFGKRKLFDDRGFASAAVFSARGDFLFVAMRGSRTVERIDVFTGAHSGSVLEVGFAPQGLAVSPDGRLLFVDAYLSRQLVVYDVESPGAVPSELYRAQVPSAEPLSPELLRGKILFNDSADPRIALDSYIACAHCHLEGRSDHRTWDFTDRGEGLRNTIDLLGRAGDGHGPLHWSANFDEVQDFEHDMRGPFRGTGLMSDAEFHSGTRDRSLGEPKAGVNADLDALAAYVTSLARHLPSPYRADDGALPAEAARGRGVFLRIGCTGCHAGPSLTDSGFDGSGAPRLHDVGTLGAGSGQRLGGALDGIDTPTLHGLWQSAPYLHDGSAGTLREVLTVRNPADVHGRTSALRGSELDDLLAYLRCLDGSAD